MLKDMKLSEFLDELASPSPAPGGGSASALLCSLGASLLCMVCQLTFGKKGYEQSEPELRKVFEEADGLRKAAEGLIDKDAVAFNGVMAAYKMPKEDAERATKIQNALKNANSVPLEVARIGIRILELSKIVAFKGNVNSISDAGVAALAAEAGVRGALLNVRVNLKSIKNDRLKGTMLIDVKRMDEKGRGLLEEVNGIVHFKLTN